LPSDIEQAFEADEDGDNGVHPSREERMTAAKSRRANTNENLIAGPLLKLGLLPSIAAHEIDEEKRWGGPRGYTVRELRVEDVIRRAGY
jgi:hypothetical protein